jgi:hypothetical protein
MARREATFRLDEGLLTRLKEVAGNERDSDEIVETALTRYLGLGTLLEQIWSENKNPLDDEEAMRVANEELHALRAERRRAG